MIRLRSNVHIVDGLKESAIYDLNRQKIYRIACSVAKRIRNGELTVAEEKLLVEKGVAISAKSEGGFSGSVVHCDNITDGIETAWLEITSRCNLRCKHCYASRETYAGDASISYWMDVVGYLKRWNCKRVVLIGGEPFLRSDFGEIVRGIHLAFPSVLISVVTNGTACKKVDVDLLKSVNAKIRFSLLGASADAHDEVTGVKGSFMKLKCSVLYARQVGLISSIGYTRISNCDCVRNGEDSNLMAFCNENFRDVPVRIAYARPQGAHNCLGQCMMFNETELATSIDPEFFRLAHNGHSCLNGKVSIDGEGKLHPCIMARYATKLFSDVKNREPREAFADWWGLKKDDIQGCRHCALRYACFDCRGYAHSLYEKPLHCKLARELPE